ncbi:MAG: TetR/AcrR family transcriptional regulator [Luteimonas sp.]
MTSDTRARLLQQAEILIRTRGYSAFSYADLAERVAITKASVHHYFPTKDALIAVLVDEYMARFVVTLDVIGRKRATASYKLRAYARLFLDGFKQGMLPLCGALSAERSALPVAMHPQIAVFFQLQLDWLTGIIRQGAADGALRTDAAPAQAALLLLSTLEGGSFVGWALEKKAPVLAAFESALRTLETSVPPRSNRSRRSLRSPVKPL